jgi:hypothetical protein
MNQMIKKLEDLFKDINKYYSKYSFKLTIDGLDNWLLNNNSVFDFFNQAFNKREFNVDVTESYISRILKDYDLSIEQIEEYGEKLRIEKEKEEEARKKRNKKILITALIGVAVVCISGFGYYFYSEYQGLKVEISNFKKNNLMVFNHDNIFNINNDSIIILNKEDILPSKFALKPSSQFCCYSFIPNKQIETSFKKPVTQFPDTTLLFNYNPKQKIRKIFANKILREVETEEEFMYGVGGYINGNYRKSFFDKRNQFLTNRFSVFDENIIEFYGEDSIELKYVENNFSKIREYLNKGDFNSIKIKSDFFNKTELIKEKEQPKSFILKLSESFYQSIPACNLPTPMCGYREELHQKRIFSSTQKIYLVDYIISDAYARYYGVVVENSKNQWNLLWVSDTYFFDVIEIIPSNEQLPIAYNSEVRQQIILKTIDKMNQ